MKPEDFDGIVLPEHVIEIYRLLGGEVAGDFIGLLQMINSLRK
ncbi:hypothetical protein [Methanosarcina soligelidi]|nr:hypothetical protein [Methanosarcina soligelidi]